MAGVNIVLGFYLQVADGNVGNLQTNFWVDNFISLLNFHANKEKGKPLICENCDSGDASKSRCADCCFFLCDFCVKAHRRTHNLKHHQIFSLEEIKSGGPKCLVKPVNCEKHRGKSLKLFCKSCDKAICRDCTVVDHQGHKYLFVADAAEDEKARVNQLLRKAKGKASILTNGVEAVKEMEVRVQAKFTGVKNEIDSFIDDHIKALEEKRTKLKTQAEKIRQDKTKKLQIQRENLMTALASVNNSVEFTVRTLGQESDVQMLSTKKQLVTNLSKINSSTWDCKPCEEDILRFTVNQDIWKMVDKIASVEGNPGLSRYEQQRRRSVDVYGEDPRLLRSAPGFGQYR